MAASQRSFFIKSAVISDPFLGRPDVTRRALRVNGLDKNGDLSEAGGDGAAQLTTRSSGFSVWQITVLRPRCLP